MFPKRDHVQNDGHNRGALNHLHQTQSAKVVQQCADDDCGHGHADQKHHIQQRNNLGAGFFGCAISGQRQTRRLGHVHAKTGQKERQSGPNFACPFGASNLIAG